MFFWLPQNSSILHFYHLSLPGITPFHQTVSWWSKCWATWANRSNLPWTAGWWKAQLFRPTGFLYTSFLDLGVKDLVQKDKRQSWKSWKKGMWEKCWSGFWGVWCCDALHCLVREIAGQAYMTKAQSRQLDSSSIVSCRCPFLKQSFICALFLASAFLLDFCLIFTAFLFCNVIALPQQLCITQSSGLWPSRLASVGNDPDCFVPPDQSYRCLCRREYGLVREFVGADLKPEHTSGLT